MAVYQGGSVADGSVSGWEFSRMAMYQDGSVAE